MSNEYIIKNASQSDYKYQVLTDRHDLLTFVELMALKEEVDKLVSDEQSRLLSLSLLGGLDDCYGCKI